MGHDTHERWHRLAVMFADAVEAEHDLAEVVGFLERAVGLAVLEGPDPDPWVTARRFARVHAAALRSCDRDAEVTAAVDDVAARLSTIAPGPEPSHPDTLRFPLCDQGRSAPDPAPRERLHRPHRTAALDEDGRPSEVVARRTELSGSRPSR